MLDELFRINDEVVVTIPKENREAGYNPCPDGTKAVVLGFSETHYGRLHNFGIKPGVYVSHSPVKLRSEDGKEFSLFSGYLELVDQVEHERRLVAFRAHRKEHPADWRNKEFLRELPETPFWEGDFVRAHARLALTSVYSEMPPKRDPDVFQIIGVDYHYLTQLRSDQSKYPAYKISSELGAGWHTSASEDDMVLVERGPVWKYYHGEPIEFASLEAEAWFFEALGFTEEVPNPASGLYKWTLEEVLEAIKNGLVHGFAMSGGLLGGRPSIIARRFKDYDLGRRVAQATLEGFKVAKV